MNLHARLADLEVRLALGPRRPWRVAAELKVVRFLIALLGDQRRAPEIAPARETTPPARWEEPPPDHKPRKELLAHLHEENRAARRELAERLSRSLCHGGTFPTRGLGRRIRDLRER